MEFGLLLPQFGPMARAPGARERIREVAQAAENLGYDIVWTAEHVIYPRRIETPYPYGGRFPYAVTDPFLDVATTLAWVAGFTSRIRLGSAVMVLPYHHPILLAKALATLDLLSGGRLVLGVAGGWLAEEFEMLGVPFAERGARTDEGIALLRALWTQDEVDFHGRWFHLEGAAFFPKPVQRPHPPIWIGGGSPAALRRVARLGDGWIAVPRTRDALARDIAALRRLAQEAGRDPGAIAVASSGGASSVAELADLVPELEHIGVTSVTVPVLSWGRSFGEGLDLMAEFASRAGLGGALRAE